VYHEAHRLDADGFLTDNSGWTLSKWGGLAGGQAGYNWTTCSTVWGIEVDGSWVGVKNTFRDQPNTEDVDNSITTKVNALFTARLRTGVVLDNLLLYVTGGVAGARIRTTWADLDEDSFVEFKEWRWGWTAGFGTEWRAPPYRRSDVGRAHGGDERVVGNQSCKSRKSVRRGSEDVGTTAKFGILRSYRSVLVP